MIEYKQHKINKKIKTYTAIAITNGNNNSGGNASKELKQFWAGILPNDFTNKILLQPWYINYYSKLLIEHSYLCILSNYTNKRTYRLYYWLLLFSRIINFLLINTIITYYYYNDNTLCNNNHTLINCNNKKIYDSLTNLCYWDEQTQSCGYNNNIGTNIISTFLLIIIITTLALPIDYCIQLLLNILKNYIFNELNNNSINSSMIGTNEQTDNVTNIPTDTQQSQTMILLNPLDQYQNHIGTILRAARLIKMQQLDIMHASSEASMILHMTSEHTNAHNQTQLNINNNNNNKSIKNNKNNKNNGFSLFQSKKSNISLESNKTLYSYNNITKSKYLLTLKIQNIRNETNEIINELKSCVSVDQQNTLLLKYFIINCFNGYQKYLVKYYLINNNNSNNNLINKQSKYFHIKYYALFVLLLIYYFGTFLFYLQTD